eukprot:4428849-Pyramimonas_sp.AAC.3
MRAWTSSIAPASESTKLPKASAVSPHDRGSPSRSSSSRSHLLEGGPSPPSGSHTISRSSSSSSWPMKSSITTTLEQSHCSVPFAVRIVAPSRCRLSATLAFAGSHCVRRVCTGTFRRCFASYWAKARAT